MAYQFPLEGGRINASVGGNSTSAGAGYSLVSTGTLLLAGGNNITLSQNGSAITISGANAPSGSINFSASNTSANLASVTFSNSNGVSFGLNAGVITGSVNTSYAASNHSHGNPTLNLTNISGTTASASNGLTLNLSAASQSNQVLSLYAASNTFGQSSSTTMNASSLAFNGFGNVSVGFGSNSILINGSQSWQTQNVIQGIIASGSTNRTGDISFANSNGVTFGLSNNTVTASVAGGGGLALANSQTTYSTGTVNLIEGSGAITIGSTTGQKFNFSVPAQSSLSVTGALSISRNASTISIGAPAFSAGMSTIGNTAGTAGTASNQVIFAGGNNITLSQSTGAGGNTISIIGAAGGGGGGGIALANSQTTYSSGTVNLFEGSGAITIGSATGQRFNLSVPAQSTISATGAVSISTNGSTISIGAPAFSAGMSTIGNTAGTAGTASNQLILAGGNNITLSQSTGVGGNTVSISAANQSIQTQNAVSVMGSTGNISFANSNNVSFGGNGSTITASASFNQSNQNLSLYAAGNTTQNSSTVVNASNLSFNGIGGVSVGYSNGSIQISGATGGGGGGGIALANSQTTYTNGTANLVEGGGAITIASGANQSLRFSVPATSSLAVTGGLSISTAGNTVSLGVQAVPRLSRWEYPNNVFTSLGLNGNGSLSIEHMYVPFNVTGTAMKIGGSLSAQTNTSATVASANISLWMGIYTLSGSTLSLASSGSALNGFQWSVSNSSTANTSINGMRQMTVPMDVNMSAGEYWVAAAISSQTTYTSAAYSIFGNNLINSAGSGAVLMPIGGATSDARDAMLFQGIYTTLISTNLQSVIGPQSIIGAHINNLQPAFVMRANFYNAIYNTTY